MARIFIGLGSNLGDRLNNLRQAIRNLENSGQIFFKTCSSVYQTEPVGNLEQPQFLNMAAELETTLSPLELIARLKEIEKVMGRKQTGHWGPREIDLDILYYENKIINSEQLRVPHPEISKRKFVLVPMNEIAGEFIDPLRHLNIKELLQRCSDTGHVEKIAPPLDKKVKV